MRSGEGVCGSGECDWGVVRVCGSGEGVCVRQKETYWGTYPGSKTAYAFTILLKAYGHAMRTEVGQASGSM